MTGGSQVPSRLLLAIDRFEERAEITFANAARALALDYLIEHRRTVLHISREDLEQVSLRITIDENPQLLKRLDWFVDLADAPLQILVVRRRCLQKLDPTVA